MNANPSPIAYWNSDLALLWTKNIPPCRPSYSEMSIYTKYLRIIQERNLFRKIKVLILGSSAEFRDWGFQENLDVTIIDCSKDYNLAIKRELRHKDCEEKLIIERWQDMSFDNEFDLIVGDLVIGNLYPEEVPPFLKRISRALIKDGFFMTKSFFYNENKPIKPYKEIILDFYKTGITYHPYSKLIYKIAISCMDKETNMLNFKQMYIETVKLYEAGIMKFETYKKFCDLGWDKDMKFLFHIPTIEQWEKWICENLIIYNKEYGLDLYSEDFPIYIITTK